MPALRYFGTNTISISHEGRQVLIDPYFSRIPGVLGLGFFIRKIEPDETRIRKCLRSCGLSDVQAVLTTHSHFDHAMDAPVVARLAGGLLIGGESTLTIGRSYGLPEAQMRAAGDCEPIRTKDFTICFLPSRHLPLPALPKKLLKFDGAISRPLKTPCHAFRFREGECRAIQVEVAGRSVLVFGSAGWAENALQGVRVDALVLAIGGLGIRRKRYWRRFLEQTAGLTHPRHLLISHWDDFSQPPSKDPAWLPKTRTPLGFIERWMARHMPHTPVARMALDADVDI